MHAAGRYGEWWYRYTHSETQHLRDMVRVTRRPAYTSGKYTSYPLDRSLGGPHSQSGSLEEKGLLPLPSMKPWFLRHPARNLATISNEPSRLGYWYTSFVFKNHFTLSCMCNTNCILWPKNHYYNTAETNIILAGTVDFHYRYLHNCQVGL